MYSYTRGRTGGARASTLGAGRCADAPPRSPCASCARAGTRRHFFLFFLPFFPGRFNSFLGLPGPRGGRKRIFREKR